MKKFMTVLISVLLVSTLLVSCGGNKKEAAPKATETKTTTAAPAPAAPAPAAPKAAAPKAAAPKAEAPKTEAPAKVAEAPKAAAPKAADEGVVFKIANGAEPESLDPAQIQGVPEHRIIETLFEGLIATDPKTANGVPGLAESWDISESGTQYTFHLRHANWSDGVPITANDVVYSWLRELAPETASPYAWFPCMFLEGAADYNDGKADASAVAIRALDDYTFQMDLIGPLPYVLGALTHYSFAVVPQHAIEKFGEKWVQPGNFVGNGPYVLDEWVPQSFLSAKKNMQYWDKDNVKLDKVIFYASDDNNTVYNMYLSGEIDWDTNVPADQIEAIKMRNDYQVAPQLSTYYYTIQTQKPPMDNVNVRKALSLSVDRQAMVDQVTKGGQIPAWGVVPELPDYSGLGEPEYDVEEAQELLAKAGYPNGIGFPTIELLYNTNDRHKMIAEFVQQEWKNNLGINVTLVNEEWATYLADRNAGNFQIARAGWVGDYQDPNTFLDMFITGAGMNGGRYSNDTYDVLINEAARMEAGDDRMGVLLTAEDILINEDQAIIPFYYYVSENIIDTNKWGGWYPNVMDYHPTKDIYLK